MARTSVRGVRSWWETWATKSRRTASARRSRVTSPARRRNPRAACGPPPAARPPVPGPAPPRRPALQVQQLVHLVPSEDRRRGHVPCLVPLRGWRVQSILPTPSRPPRHPYSHPGPCGQRVARAAVSPGKGVGRVRGEGIAPPGARRATRRRTSRSCFSSGAPPRAAYPAAWPARGGADAQRPGGNAGCTTGWRIPGSANSSRLRPPWCGAARTGSAGYTLVDGRQARRTRASRQRPRAFDAPRGTCYRGSGPLPPGGGVSRRW